MIRTFKTASFTKKASKFKENDLELCKTIEQVRLGQAVDLGGGVYKKRIKTNELRSLVLAKGGKHWLTSICSLKMKMKMKKKTLNPLS